MIYSGLEWGPARSPTIDSEGDPGIEWFELMSGRMVICVHVATFLMA